MEWTELKTKSLKELHDLLVNSRSELRTLKSKIAGGAHKQTHTVSVLRKTIARAMVRVAQHLADRNT